jgi:hypothetical protein
MTQNRQEMSKRNDLGTPGVRWMSPTGAGSDGYG